MAVFNEPTQWDHTLGINADTSTLPDDAVATAGIASLQKLFQIINATPLEAGGIAPDREDVNALFKYLGDSIFYAMNGGVPSYNAVYDYIPGRVVLYDNNLYKCIQAHSHTTPRAPTNTSYWQKIVIQSDIANFVTLNTAQTISAIKNFSALPTTSVAPTDSTQLANKSYVDTKVSLSDNQTVAGTKTFSSSPLMPTATAGDSSAKGASTAFVQNAIAQLVPTGTIVAFGGVTPPNGFLICNGAGISRSTFSNLFTKIGTTYGTGVGSTTFNIPDLRDRYIIGAGTNLLGVYIAEQLPNITGEIGQTISDGGLMQFPKDPAHHTLSGVFNPYNYTGEALAVTGISAAMAKNLQFNANRASSTYVTNGHVYPKSIALNFIIKT